MVLFPIFKLLVIILLCSSFYYNKRRVYFQDNKFSYVRPALMENRRSTYKVTVLDEINNHDYYYVYNDQPTIFDAIGLAGDLTIFAGRRHVKLIRSVPGNRWL
jgi:polysaccharide biosynthesis/export protein